MKLDVGSDSLPPPTLSPPSPSLGVCMKGVSLLRLSSRTLCRPSGTASTLATTSLSSSSALRLKQQERLEDVAICWSTVYIVDNCIHVLFKCTDASSSPTLLSGKSTSQVGLPRCLVDCYQVFPRLWCLSV